MSKRQCCEWLDRGMKDGVPTILCKIPARWNLVVRKNGLTTNAGDYCTRHMRKQRADHLSAGFTCSAVKVVAGSLTIEVET